MSIHYGTAEPANHDAIRQFLSENGWGARMADAERFRRMMSGAARTVVAWEADRIVGFGRALCDDASNGYLSMIAVAEDRRGQGIGTEIVRRLVGDDPEITWVLRAGRDSRGFWENLGFRPSEIAMERTRRTSDSAGNAPSSPSVSSPKRNVPPGRTK